MQLDIKEGTMDRQVVFRINDGMGPEILQQVFLERGWVEYDDEVHSPDGWNLWWKTSRFRTGEYSNLMPWQHINHFPSCALITKKDALCRNLRKMSVAHGPNAYNFSPRAFNLPNDYTKFVSEFAASQHLSKKDGSNNTWICKPAESSRGRGIFIFNDLSELQYDCNAVVQHYISNPLLIGGYKFDIRVYVVVPSFHPLQIYIHEEGLVRFSTEKYDLARKDNIFAHLTNTSINKHSPGYATDKDEVGHGCKWTISQLRRYFLQNDIDDRYVWKQITNIIILTVLMQAPSAPKLTNCFELYGFDILIDSNMKPWLLEVNFSPALSLDCQADLLAKKSMLHDLMSLVQISSAAESAYSSPRKDLDTARTVASTGSRVSQSSSTTSVRGHRLSPNQRLSPNGQNPGFVKKRRQASRRNSGNNDTNKLFSVEQFSSSRILRSLRDTDVQNGNLRSKIQQHSATPLVENRNSPDAIDILRMRRQGSIPKDRTSSMKGTLLPEATSIDNYSAINADGCDIDLNGNSSTLRSYTNCFNDENLKSAADDFVNNKLSLGFSDNDRLQSENNNKLRVPGMENYGNSTNGIESNSFGVVLVKGNMKGHGEKLVISPTPPSNLNIGKERQTKSVSLVASKRLEKQESEERLQKAALGLGVCRTNRSGHDSNTSNIIQSASPSAESETWNYRQPVDRIPRNFSKQETHRFPNASFHARPGNVVPGKNGVAPLTKIPAKAVGKMFLVFPFNEATQRMTQATELDTKAVIREVIRRTNKPRKKSREPTSPDITQVDGIWAPINNII